ncbi:MAG TPA: O-antigen ligase family protein, partial [Thauera sp.]|nr:O-antigen ligase family protein [Thauera sp.]
MEIVIKRETGLPPVKKATGWQLHGLIFTTLYCVFMNAAPSAFGMSAMWLFALVLALVLGGGRHFYAHYRVVLWGVLGLTGFSVLTARIPGRAAGGGYELLRSLTLILPALVLVAQDARPQVMNWLKVYVLVFSLVFGGIYLASLAPPGPNALIYVWADEYFGNPHNLINVSATVLLSALVVFAFERSGRVRMVFAALLVFAAWMQWVLQSEGSYLAFAICACAWVALRYRGWLSLLGVLGVLGGVAMYALLMAYSDLATAMSGVSLGGFEIRAVIDARVLALVAESPWVGYGMNNFKGLAEATIQGVSFLHPHQIYLEALFSFGVLGCVLFAAVMYGVFRFSSRVAV